MTVAIQGVATQISTVAGTNVRFVQVTSFRVEEKTKAYTETITDVENETASHKVLSTGK